MRPEGLKWMIGIPSLALARKRDTICCPLVLTAAELPCCLPQCNASSCVVHDVVLHCTDALLFKGKGSPLPCTASLLRIVTTAVLH